MLNQPLCIIIAPDSLVCQVIMKRRFIRGVPNHCYQKTARGVLLFYSVTDFVVFFTHICVSAMRHRVRILSIVLMPDHLHICVEADSVDELNDFVKCYSSPFAIAHNRRCSYYGALFRHRYGSAPKKTDKAIRTNLIYIGNNPVERHLTKKAEDYQWNFLKYYKCPNPFSDKLVLSHASRKLRNAVSEVNTCRRALIPIKYELLQRIASPLSAMEKRQLVDYIVSAYNVIDYEAAISYFGTYENMIGAMHVTTGSEYDMKEEHPGWDDSNYAKMHAVVMRECGFGDIHQVLSLSEQEKKNLVKLLAENTHAPLKQRERYLRVR